MLALCGARSYANFAVASAFVTQVLIGNSEIVQYDTIIRAFGQ
jgi:hypothetical protein